MQLANTLGVIYIKLNFTTDIPFIGSDKANEELSWLTPVLSFANKVCANLIVHMPKKKYIIKQWSRKDNFYLA